MRRGSRLRQVDGSPLEEPSASASKVLTDGRDASPFLRKASGGSRPGADSPQFQPSSMHGPVTGITATAQTVSKKLLHAHASHSQTISKSNLRM